MQSSFIALVASEKPSGKSSTSWTLGTTFPRSPYELQASRHLRSSAGSCGKLDLHSGPKASSLLQHGNVHTYLNETTVVQQMWKRLKAAKCCEFKIFTKSKNLQQIVCHLKTLCKDRNSQFLENKSLPVLYNVHRYRNFKIILCNGIFQFFQKIYRSFSILYITLY